MTAHPAATFPASPPSDECPSVARNWAADLLQSWSLTTDVIDNARLVVSELMTNATTHGQGQPALSLGYTAASPTDVRLRIEVHDDAPPTPALLRALRSDRSAADPTLEEDGRGLALVRALADDHVRLIREAPGKSVRVDLALPRQQTLLSRAARTTPTYAPATSTAPYGHPDRTIVEDRSELAEWPWGRHDPSAAVPVAPDLTRVTDAALGGNHHTPLDRVVAAAMTAARPHWPDLLRAERAFHSRALRYLVHVRRITRFLVLGGPVLTHAGVHYTRWLSETARTVYVQSDWLSAMLGAAQVAEEPGTHLVHADLARPDEIAGVPQVRSLLGQAGPLAVLVVGLLHHLDDPGLFLKEVRRLLRHDDVLVLTHAGEHFTPSARLSEGEPVPALYPRPRAEVEELLGGLTPDDPGVVPASLWRPDTPDNNADRRPERLCYAAVATVPRSVRAAASSGPLVPATRSASEDPAAAR